MSTNLIIATNNAALEATTITCSHPNGFSSLWPWQNILGPTRYQYAHLTAATTVYFQYSFAEAKLCNYVAISSAVAADGKTLTVGYSDDGSSWSTAATATISKGTSPYIYFLEFTGSSHVYWRLTITNAKQLGHISFGSVLDLGQDAESYEYDNASKDHVAFESYAGNVYAHNVEERLNLSLSWNGITDVQAIRFDNEIIRQYKKQSYIFYCRSLDKVLGGVSALHGWIAGPMRTQNESIPDFNYLSCSVEQMR